jgi:protein TonB
MSRSQTELNARMQRDTADTPPRRPSGALWWLLLLLVVLAAGTWWFGTQRRDAPAVYITPTTAPPPAVADEAASRPANPSRASATRSERAKPAIADRSASLRADTPKPKYPPSALRANAGGTVTLEVQVDPQGEPARISIAKRSGNRDLDRAALTAAAHWRFHPATRNGQAVAAAVRVPVEFSPQ